MDNFKQCYVTQPPSLDRWYTWAPNSSEPSAVQFNNLS
jgi:hypothetical protein